MKRRFLYYGISAASAAALLLLPRLTLSLNPNHDCTFCHGLHSAPGSQLTRDADVEVLCLTCHGPAGISVLKADVHTNGFNSAYPPFNLTCMVCHTPHSEYPNYLGTHFHSEIGGNVPGVNIKLVGRKLDSSGFARIQTPNSGIRDVVFEFRGREASGVEEHSFADNDTDGNGTWDLVCETCHTLTKFHRNNSSGGHNHNTGRTCPQCHEHVTNFIP